MPLFPLLFGLGIVLLGLLTRKFPEMISGYTFMPAEKKKNIDMKGVGRLYGNGMMIIGLVAAAGFYLFRIAGWRLPSELSLIFPLMIGLLILIPMSRRYDHNTPPKKWSLEITLLVVVTAGIGILLATSMTPARLIVGPGSIRITGMYNTEIPADGLAGAELSNAIPRVTRRTNGSSLAGANKGYFQVAGFGKCLLFTHPRDKGPYLILTDTSGRKTIFKTRDKATGVRALETIREMLDHPTP